MPLWGDVLTWVAVAGTALVVARMVPPLNRIDNPTLALARRLMLPVLAVVAAIGIRAQLGYFLARDPCVQFLYVLVGIKFVESRTTRDGTLLICLAHVPGGDAILLRADHHRRGDGDSRACSRSAARWPRCMRRTRSAGRGART